MKKINILAIFFSFFINASLLNANNKYSANAVAPKEAFELLAQNPKDVFLVDCRTEQEYEFVGHPPGAYNIPYKFKTRIGWVRNLNFVKNVKERFKKDDVVIIICKHEQRSIPALEELMKAGFELVLYVAGGFEGEEINNKKSPYFGQLRRINGWIFENLPYTYKIDPEYAFNPIEPCGCGEEY